MLAIFDVLTSNLGSPLETGNFDCVFAEEWPDGVARALLTPHQALDPHNKHGELFCDRAARHEEAQARSKALPAGDRRAHVEVKDIDYGYPKFNAATTRALLSFDVTERSFRGGGLSLIEGRYCKAAMRKSKGKWRARVGHCAFAD